MKRYASLYARLVANTIVPESQNSNGCWLWTGKIVKGYGRLNVRLAGVHRTLHAHRAMEGVFLRRELERGETLDHLCLVGHCCNPDHWQPETNHRNTQLSHHRRGRGLHKAALSLPLVLTPSDDPLQGAADAAWDGIGSVRSEPGAVCPF
jgi:hypothetical protein